MKNDNVDTKESIRSFKRLENIESNYLVMETCIIDQVIKKNIDLTNTEH